MSSAKPGGSDPWRPAVVPEYARALLVAARKAAGGAYAPYSRFAVGAAAATGDGRVFTGSNMENASYRLTSCAEVGALQSASQAGALGEVVRVAVVGGLIDPPPAGTQTSAVTPCGACRQLILESAQLGGADIEVWCADLDLVDVTRSTITQLLPHAFGPRDLGQLTPWHQLAARLKERLR